MTTPIDTAELLTRPHTILPELPSVVITKDGQEVNLTGDKWLLKLSADLALPQVINWKLLRAVKAQGSSFSVLSDRATHLVMLYVASKLVKIKAATARGILRGILRFARWLALSPEWLQPKRCFDWSDLTEEIFEAWLDAEYQTAMMGEYPAHVRGFYRWGSDPAVSYSDFSERISQFLGNKRFEFAPKGGAVARRDVRRGPFSRQEMELILDACESSKGADRDRAVTWTFLNTAMRPEQMVRIRNSALQIFEEQGDNLEGAEATKESRRVYQLKVQMIKQEYAEKKYRILPLSPGCGRLLDSLRKPHSSLDEPLFWWLGSSFHHNIGVSLRRFFKKADLRSPRLPIKKPNPAGPSYEPMPVNPRRFRYGLATDRIAQGDTPENLSNFLCQTNTASVDIYVETSPLIANQFQNATDHALVPLTRRMQGHLEDTNHPVDAPSIPAVVPQASSKRELRVIGSVGIGKCGEGGLCPRNPVTGCFGCPSFIARPDAPLRELRAAILEDIDADLIEGSSPVVVEQLRNTIAEMDQWIEHIDRAKALASNKK